MDKILQLLSDFKKRIEKLERNFTLYVQGWTAVTFQNSWVNYDGNYNQCAYLRDPAGFVHLRGLVKTGTIDGSASIFTLPVGYRPQYRELHSTFSNGAAARVDITTAGAVIPSPGSNVWFSLDGISFKAV